jgi:exodeoxyribonuclease VII large subunit
MQARQRLGQASIAYAQQRVTTQLHRLQQRLDDLGFRMESAMMETLRLRQRTVADLGAAVLQHDPRQRLSMARETLLACRSRLEHVLDRRLAEVRHQSSSAESRLYRAAQVAITARRSEFVNLRGQLQSLSPLAVLQRGYALVQDESGGVIRSVRQIASGETVHTRLGDGSFSSRIAAITPQKKNKTRTDKDKPTSQ